MATQLATIQMKRGNADEWSNTKGILAEGEWGLNTTTGEVKMGDGTSLWSDLPVTLLADAGGQLPDVVRGALAKNLADTETPEGAAIAGSPVIADAISAAVSDLDIVSGEDNSDGSWRWRDEGYHEAGFFDPRDGTWHLHDLQTKRLRIGNRMVVRDNPDDPRLSFVDEAGKLAMQIRENGSVFIADPVFGKEVGAAVEKVVFLIMLGQSNGEGRARPTSARIDPSHPRILMANWVKNIQSGEAYASAPYVSGIQRASVPLSSQQSQVGLSPATVIARDYAERSGENVRIVVLNAAAGGSGLVSDPAQGNWGVNYSGSNPKLYNIARNAITATLNAIAAKYPGVPVEPWLFWHQGEADNGTSESAYASALDSVIAGLRSHLGSSTIPFTAGGMVPENNPGLGSRRALIQLPTRLEYVAYTDGIPNGGGSGSVSDIVHYTREGMDRLGRNMRRAGDRAAIASADSVPHKPLDVSATFIAGTLTVQWSEPMCRFTNFLVEYSIDGGSWTTAPRTIPADVRETVTGLVGTVVSVRVSTVNGSTATGPTIPVTATGV